MGKYDKVYTQKEMHAALAKAKKSQESVSPKGTLSLLRGAREHELMSNANVIVYASQHQGNRKYQEDRYFSSVLEKFNIKASSETIASWLYNTVLELSDNIYNEPDCKQTLKKGWANPGATLNFSLCVPDQEGNTRVFTVNIGDSHSVVLNTDMDGNFTSCQALDSPHTLKGTPDNNDELKRLAELGITPILDPKTKDLDDNEKVYRLPAKLYQIDPDIYLIQYILLRKGGLTYDERGRLLAKYGKIKKMGSLMLPRSLGDKFEEDNGLSNEPDITCITIPKNDSVTLEDGSIKVKKKYAILMHMSDGVTDEMSDANLLHIANHYKCCDSDDLTESYESLDTTEKKETYKFIYNQPNIHNLAKTAVSTSLTTNTDKGKDNTTAVMSKIRFSDATPPQAIMVGVADGHGGDPVAKYIKKNLPTLLKTTAARCGLLAPKPELVSEPKIKKEKGAIKRKAPGDMGLFGSSSCSPPEENSLPAKRQKLLSASPTG